MSEAIGDPFIPNWIGPLVDLGSYSDTVFGHKASLPIKVAFEVCLDPNFFFKEKSGRQITAKLEYRFRTSAFNPIGRLTQFSIVDIPSGIGPRVTVGPTERSKAKVRFLGSTSTYSPEIAERPRWYSLSNWIYDQLHRTIKKGSRRMLKGRRAAIRRLMSIVSSFSAARFIEETQRVSSGRTSPKRWYPRTAISPPPQHPWSMMPRLLDSVDPAVLEQSKKKLDPLYPGFRRPRRKSRVTLNSVLSKLDIANSIESKELSPYHSAIQVRDSRMHIESKLIDVGYGASQVIPVILGCLSENSGPLLVEQPEIHLHPKAQSHVAELLCETSLSRQVIIETHSEHMINRARISVAKGELDHRDVVINYVSRDKSGSHVKTIKLLSNGEFAAQWPEGFFDERYQDTVTLLRVSQKAGET